MDKKGREEGIVAEYLAGEVTLRELSAKHGVGRTTISRWVRSFREGLGKRGEAELLVSKAFSKEEAPEIVRLRRELEDAQILNKLLNAMIDIAEDDLGVSIRKKRGAKR